MRIARTAREMGIGCVTVYADADRDSSHLRAGDESVAIGASYLALDRIVDAARKTGADAIHPGYGFLAENADFAEACLSAGITFIGPRPDAIRRMGSKIAARDVAVGAGIPVVPSFDPKAVSQFPVLIKASAGGGGRGMRIVNSAAELDEALKSARSEAERAFGEGSLLIERYIEKARHIEFQIFGDHHGNLIHLFERDCSIQRRHQKIIEESPSPGLNPEVRRRMGEAAVALGRAIGYINAGTVEFLLAPSGEFFFIEANTRIQVEHPVTELITGLDLVRLQIEVAEGKALRVQPLSSGHAIEARLYAEDPANHLIPSTGTVQVWRRPAHVRVDTALEEGARVSIHYDPMLAKIISHGEDRECALRKLVHALRSTCILGLETNREYLIQILESEEFREGRATTAFLPVPIPEVIDQGCLAAGIIHTMKSPHSGVPPSYRNNAYRALPLKLRVYHREITVDAEEIMQSARVLATDGNQLTIAVDGITRTYQITEAGNEILVHSPTASLAITRLPRHPRPAAMDQRETANSPMPGQVLRILVQEGQQVKAGDSLVVLEAMKMEQTIRTSIDGVVKSILVVTGQVVAPGQLLVQIGAQENPNE